MNTTLILFREAIPPVKNCNSQSLLGPGRVIWLSSGLWDARGSNWVRLWGKLFKGVALLVPSRFLPGADGAACLKDGRKLGPCWPCGAFAPALDCPPPTSAYERKTETPPRGVQPLGISGPHWKKSPGPHMKYIVTCNYKINLIIFYVNLWFCVGHTHSHPGPRVARGPRVGHPCNPLTHSWGAHSWILREHIAVVSLPSLSL